MDHTDRKQLAALHIAAPLPGRGPRQHANRPALDRLACWGSTSPPLASAAPPAPRHPGRVPAPTPPSSALPTLSQGSINHPSTQQNCQLPLACLLSTRGCCWRRAGGAAVAQSEATRSARGPFQSLAGGSSVAPEDAGRLLICGSGWSAADDRPPGPPARRARRPATRPAWPGCVFSGHVWAAVNAHVVLDPALGWWQGRTVHDDAAGAGCRGWGAGRHVVVSSCDQRQGRPTGRSHHPTDMLEEANGLAQRTWVWIASHRMLAPSGAAAAHPNRTAILSARWHTQVVKPLVQEAAPAADAAVAGGSSTHGPSWATSYAVLQVRVRRGGQQHRRWAEGPPVKHHHTVPALATPRCLLTLAGRAGLVMR